MEARCLGFGHDPAVVGCGLATGTWVLLPGSHPGLYVKPAPVTTCSLKEHSNNSVLARFDSFKRRKMVAGRVAPQHRVMPL